MLLCSIEVFYAIVEILGRLPVRQSCNMVNMFSDRVVIDVSLGRIVSDRDVNALAGCVHLYPLKKEF